MQKVSKISEHPQNYLDPENKVKGLEVELEKIRQQIQVEVIKRSKLDTSSNWDKQLSLELEDKND